MNIKNGLRSSRGIDGAKTYSHLPPHEELTLKHEKDIVRQEHAKQIIRFNNL